MFWQMPAPRLPRARAGKRNETRGKRVLAQSPHSEVQRRAVLPCRPIGGGAAMVALLLVVASGCDGPQSALDPAGLAAEQIVQLFWWMAGGAVVIWLTVVGLFAYALKLRTHAHNERRSTLLIIGGGVVVPTVVLTILLIFGLRPLPGLLAPAPPGSLQIEVEGLQWWWRVVYPGADGSEPVELANEIRLPVGEPVQFTLHSEDVIHAFWIPSLGGKVDMIPGRRTRLTLHPTRTGVFRGACAEYCGASHALMSFDVVVMEKQEFDRWLQQQRRPAEPPSEAAAVRGRQVWTASGCGACHTIRGTAADGVVGPDLTHVGSRLSLGASVLPNDADAFYRWIAHTEQIKPDVHMPAFRMLPEADLTSLAKYLEGLE